MQKNISVWLSIIMLIINTSLIHEASCSPNKAVHFELKSVPEVPLNSTSQDPTNEERQKLCYYAFVRANLAYIDYTYVPEWKYVSELSPLYQQFKEGMYCATLPTIYLLRADQSLNVQITFLHFPVDQYVFDDNIVYADSVYLSDLTSDEAYLENQEEEEAQLVELFIEDERRNLCSRVRELVSADFLSKDVPGAQLYEFQLMNESEMLLTIAIPCPTSPKLYLYRGSSEDMVKIILLKGRIDQYEFELDDIKPISAVPLTGENLSWIYRFRDTSTLSRLHDEKETSLSRLNVYERTMLCKIARRYRASLPIVFADDMDVEEAQLYSFQYSKVRKQRSVAIQCSAPPQMYLRMDHSESSGIKIKITFVKNLADHFVYAVQVTSNPIGKLYRGVKLNESDYKGLRRYHPFTRLSLEEQWNLCFAAQRYILSKEEGGWNFRFAEHESTISANKLLLIPAYIDLWEMIEYSGNVMKADLYIICSEWPKVYVRLGRSTTKEIIVELEEDDLV